MNNEFTIHNRSSTTFSICVNSSSEVNNDFSNFVGGNDVNNDFSNFINMYRQQYFCNYRVETGNYTQLRPKWPISIKFRNIWPKDTVCVIIRHLPLFGVLELGELEYPFFFVHRGTDHQHV